MYVSRRVRAGYIAHPRTASRATAHALVHQLGFERVGSHHDGLEDVVDGFGPGWRWITVVRNHWSTIASWSRKLERVEWTAEWWKQWCRTEGVDYVSPPPPHWRLFFHTKHATDVIRFERLEDGLDEVLTDCGLEPVALPEEADRSSSRPPYREVLNAEVARWVADRFAEEIERFGYSY